MKSSNGPVGTPREKTYLWYGLFAGIVSGLLVGLYLGGIVAVVVSIVIGVLVWVPGMALERTARKRRVRRGRPA